MEHPPLVAGHTIRFAVHLTKLADFQALNAGRPSIEMSPESRGLGCHPPRIGAASARRISCRGQAPARGTVPMGVARRRARSLRSARSRLDEVFADEATAIADAEKQPEKDAAAIAYLKEQQWTNPFSTAVVSEGDVRTSIRVPAAIEPVTGGEAVVAAPADGRYASQQLPSVGDRVAAGQTLGRLEPRLSSGGEDRASLESAVTEAQTALEARRRTRSRGAAARGTRGPRPARRRRAAGRGGRRSARDGGRARLAQRDEVLRERRRYGIRECVHSSRADRGAYDRGVRGARRLVHGRCAAVPHRPRRPGRAAGAGSAK